MCSWLSQWVIARFMKAICVSRTSRILVLNSSVLMYTFAWLGTFCYWFSWLDSGSLSLTSPFGNLYPENWFPVHDLQTPSASLRQQETRDLLLPKVNQQEIRQSIIWIIHKDLLGLVIRASCLLVSGRFSGFYSIHPQHHVVVLCF